MNSVHRRFGGRLILSRTTMLVAIVLLVVPVVLNLPVPDWWERAMALIIASGGFAELYAVWSYLRAVR